MANARATTATGILIGSTFYELGPRCRRAAGGEWYCRTHGGRVPTAGEARRHAGCVMFWICPTHGIEQPWQPSGSRRSPRVAVAAAAILAALLSSAPGRASTLVGRVLGDIADRRTATIEPNVVVVGGSTVACSVANQRETKALGFRKSHLVACGSLAGEVRGALLSASGATRCPISGFIDFDLRCGELVVCGTSFPSCF